MKKVFYLALISISLVIFSLAFPQDNIKEYYQLKIDNSYNIQGRFPVETDSLEIGNFYRMTYDKQNRLIKIEYFKRFKSALNPLLNVAVIKIIYGTDNEVWKFYDASSEPVVNSLVAYAYKIHRDFKDGFIKISYLDQNDKLIQNNQNVTWNILILDSKRLAVKSFFFNSEGDTISNSAGEYELRYEYDEYGNNIKISNYDNNGDLLEVKKIGAAINMRLYDKYGSPIEDKYYDRNNELINSSQWKYPRVCADYDKYGNRIKLSNFDNNNTLRYELYYDIYGNLLETRAYDENGKLNIDPNMECAILRRKYDDKDNLIELSKYGIDGKLKGNDSGVAIGRYFHNENNIRVEEHGLDEQMKLVIISMYDTLGNMIEQSFYDGDRILKENDLGFAVVKWTYDDMNKINEGHYQNKLRETTLILKYDDNSNIIERSHYDGHGHLEGFNRWGGAAILRNNHDEKGNIIETSYYGIDGNLMEPKDYGYAIHRTIYNEKGEVFEEFFYDVDGKLLR